VSKYPKLKRGFFDEEAKDFIESWPWIPYMLEDQWFVQISRNCLTLQGLLLDYVQVASANFSDTNIKSILLSAFKDMLSMVDTTKFENVTAVARQVIVTVNSSTASLTTKEEEFFGFVSQWSLEDSGLISETIKANPRLRSISDGSSNLERCTRTKVKKNITVQELCSSETTLQWMVEKSCWRDDDIISKLFIRLVHGNLRMGREPL
jgi:hypothetical protein